MPTSSTLKRCGLVLAGTAAINAVVFSPLGDEGFFAIALLGPIITGFVVGLTYRDTRLAAAAWAASAVCWLVIDWLVNQEDVVFHAVMAFVMAGLVVLGAAAGHAVRRIARAAPSARA